MFWRMIKVAEALLFTDKTRNKKITDSGNTIRYFWLRRRVSAVSALRSLGRASSLDNFRALFEFFVSRSSREPTIIRAFYETHRRNKKITDSLLAIRYFWLRQRDLNPRPLGP